MSDKSDADNAGATTIPDPGLTIPEGDTSSKSVELDGPPKQPAEEALNEPDPNSNSEELLSQARQFLSSPAIRNQDVSSKRQFLLKKGLTPEDAESLLEETNVPPPVPPRTYLPPTPPSQLPALMISLARTIGVLSAASGAALWVYHSSILPRLSDSYAARHALRTHQLELAKSLTEKLESLKHTINPTVTPQIQLESSSTDDALASKTPEPSDGPLLDVLELPPTQVNYDELPTTLSQLATLASTSLSTPTSTSHSILSASSSRTLESLTSLSAYITSETYAVPNTSYFRLAGSGSTNSRALGPAEEEVRREIKALKGLVLNRRSFAPSSPAQVERT